MDFLLYDKIKQQRKIDIELKFKMRRVGESNPNKINVYRIKYGNILIKAALNIDLISSKVTFHINCFEPKIFFFLLSSNLLTLT